MSNDVTVPRNLVATYDGLARRRFNMRVLMDGSRPFDIEPGMRFKWPNNAKYYDATFVFCCVQQPLMGGGAPSVFFVKEGTVEPFTMPLSEWLSCFRTSTFKVVEGKGDLTYRGLERFGEDQESLPHHKQTTSPSGENSQ